jgi:hypothetical protein
MASCAFASEIEVVEMMLEGTSGANRTRILNEMKFRELNESGYVLMEAVSMMVDKLTIADNCLRKTDDANKVSVLRLCGADPEEGCRGTELDTAYNAAAVRFLTNFKRFVPEVATIDFQADVIIRIFQATGNSTVRDMG